jgi:ATP-dependent helicase/nuclease subunit B
MEQTLSALLEKLAAGCTVLTVNSRLALHLHKDYEIWQQAQGSLSWTTPSILPWNVWLQQQWQEAQFQQPGRLPSLLTEEQSLAVWEAVVFSSEQGKFLLNIQATARSAMQAWRLLRQWRQTVALLAAEVHPDTAAFHAWAGEFQSRCAKHRWLDQESLPDWLVDSLNAGDLSLDGNFLLLGFDELTPQHQAVISALHEQGAAVGQVEAEQEDGRVYQQPCSDSQAEIRQVALWLRHLMQQDAAASIGVVVPDLAALRDDIERIFDEVLLPDAVLDLQRQPQRPYNISLGRAMAQLPMVHIALTLLDVLRPLASLADWSRLLLSPWLTGADQELAARAQLDALLRRHGEARPSLHQVLRHSDYCGCERLSRLLQSLQQTLDELPRRQDPEGWARSFQHLLQQAGWPGDRSLDSEAYQTLQAWHKLLARFAALGQVTANLTYGEALKQLRQQAGSALFQAQSKNEPVQVLGVLEAAGVRFSHCWVMGLHDGVWPPSPSPNPFLPITLQRRLNMSHASAERELAYAEQVSRRLFAAAPEVIVSYPRREGDSDLRPSPMIAEAPPLPQAPWLEAELPRYRDQLFAARQLQQYSDWQAPELPINTEVRGGTSLFKDQAACPFRAFARHRLNAEGLEAPQPGLDAAERGNLAHRMMELLWNELKDQRSLNSLDESALQAMVENVAAQVIEAEAEQYPQVFTERFAALEKGRLTKLALAWLVLEKERAPFEVAALEQERQVTLAGLNMKVKADRIDRLESAGEMIIDYKTGRTSTNDWFGERPNEPQLPLYAVTSEQEVTALAFATLRPGEMALKGVSRDEGIAKGIKPGEVDWYVQQGLWRDELNRLGENFRHGHAEVDPKDAYTHNSQACTYCDLGPLCRINELSGSALDTIGGGDEDE